MACPKCGCKVTYFFEPDIWEQEDYEQERCAACGHIFYLMDSDDDEDFEEV